MHRDGQHRFIGWWDKEFIAFVLHAQGSRPFQEVPSELLLRIVFSSLSAFNKVRWVFQATSCLCTAKYTHSKEIRVSSGYSYLSFKGMGQTLHPDLFFCISAFIPEFSQHCSSAPALLRQSQHGLFIVPTVPAGFSRCSRSLNSCMFSKDVPFGECRLCLYFAHAKRLLHFCHL